MHYITTAPVAHSMAADGCIQAQARHGAACCTALCCVLHCATLQKLNKTHTQRVHSTKSWTNAKHCILLVQHPSTYWYPGCLA